LKAMDVGIVSFPFSLNKRYEYLRGAWDFIGINYYQRVLIDAKMVWKDFIMRNITIKGKERFEVEGAQFYPPGIYDAMIRLKKYNKPVYITENGLPTNNEEDRIKFLKDNLKNLHKAISQGVDIRGYFYWSLIDNFEWFLGFEPKFGLVSVDLKTQKRALKKSAYAYKKICQTNSVQT